MSESAQPTPRPSGPPREPDPKYLQMVVKENGKPFTELTRRRTKQHRSR